MVATIAVKAVLQVHNIHTSGSERLSDGQVDLVFPHTLFRCASSSSGRRERCHAKHHLAQLSCELSFNAHSGSTAEVAVIRHFSRLGLARPYRRYGVERLYRV